ncbi:non-ribosomal peptide synthetase [Cylindrospermum sp. FACHB-282]|uniref:non-ribosomal peptide synthetase n=1 Tax=Cylindrospermum sp. FACHB-282 TaxID=2692794 RepID=UPI0016899795|nr:non-ribosomal peptide synthetase [Cylindrospermum sp. FACHB-282]MBD2385752.1 amino acid adenylation domain-containing protein [Cylindrospermum sp. FACHB-282]
MIETISGFQLSPQQKRLWFLQQNSSAFRTKCLVVIGGHLQAEIFTTAIQQVIYRHEILRTSFDTVPGVKTPVMVIGENNSFSWRYIDLSDANEQEQLANVEDLFAAKQSGQIWCLSLIKMSKDKHILIVDLPALCADSQTIYNLVNEISGAYAAWVEGEELSDKVVQYLQFSEWQNQLFEDEDAEAAKEYWSQQKVSSLATLKLPFERKYKNEFSFETDDFKLIIDPDVRAKVEILAHQQDVSVAVVLVACWQTLIWRLTGQSEVMIGMASDRREYAELHGVLGLLATWIPIKSDLAADLRFAEVLELLAQSLENGKEWQDYFVPEPVEDDDPLAFPIGFEFQQIPEKSLAGGVSFSVDKVYSCIEPFKVKLTCIQGDRTFTAKFDYDINCFSSASIERLGRQFQTLLSSATEHPQAAINQLDILSQCDRHQLLVEFNQTQIDYPQNKCIHQLITEQAEITPHQIAVICEGKQLTYQELNRKANQLAHYLQKQGVKPEVLVGLCVERSLNMIVGMLGILKAGGAYIPLDPALPTEGINLRLQDAQTPLLLTQQHLVKVLPIQTTQVICLDTDWETIAQESDVNPGSEVTPENLVYVVFTSGSTGKPKGVAIEHQQLLNYTLAIADKLNLPATANFATVSTLSADLGNTMIFPALCRGGCLHIISSDCATDATSLAQYCREYSIDCLKIVPSHLAALLASAPAESQFILPRQRLILGGEAATWELVERIQQQAPQCQIFNHYGPTEATVGVLTYPVFQSQPANLDSETVPLGSPIANTQVYILDQQLQPAPIGVPGELYIGGACLARSYFNQPELTAQQFISHPFNQESRLYKTGDLGRYLSDGNIEFLGRVDQQVKIRGYRVELAEIEVLLRQNIGVQQTVVTVNKAENNQRLTAYIVPNREQVPSINHLRSFLKHKLPEYMIPSAFVFLKTLPLTPNGKIDRHALPAPDSLRPELEATYEPPQTGTQETIAKIWQQLLHLEKVGINDNFFDLGGHSLLLVQVHSKLRVIFPKQISITNLFEYPTIRTLAKYLTQDIGETASFIESNKRAESRIASRQQRTRNR